MNDTSDKKQMRRELLVFTLGELICAALVVGAFALLRKLDAKVLLGAALGALVPIGNYFLTAVAVNAAANRAEAGEPEKGSRLIRLSTVLRFGLMIALLVVGAKSGCCNVIAMIIPLLASRLLLYVGEFFRK